MFTHRPHTLEVCVCPGAPDAKTLPHCMVGGEI